MPHLTTDRLAALGDEQATPAEAVHLAACADCAHERDAYLALIAMAHAERAPLGLPLTRWDAIAAALASESGIPAAPSATRRAVRWPLRAAAGLLLVASGAMLGRASVGATLMPSLGRPAAGPPSLASQPPVTADTGFASVDDARDAQRRSEQLYRQAVAYLAEYDSTATDDGSPLAYKSRLAVLDRVISATSAAMRETPHDPVINGYYLTTLGQREATIRQLNTALPASLRLNSF
jgi:hypothetical protein